MSAHRASMPLSNILKEQTHKRLICSRPDASKIYVAVGYGFFVEFTHAEALKFIEKKTNQLTE